MISKISDHLAEVVRVVDRFTTKVNPDDIIKFPLKSPKLYDGLSDEVLVELGRGLTDEVVEQLARLDNLPIIGLGNSPSEGDPNKKAADRNVKDDSSSQHRAEEEEGQDDEADDGVGGEEEQNDESETGKTVRFKPPEARNNQSCSP